MKVSEKHTASICRAEFEDRGSMFLEKTGIHFQG
jgi:hypothetical protein